MDRKLKVILSPTRPALRFFFRAFFRAPYLRGRHFEQGYAGYLWAARAAWSRNILRLARPVPWPTTLTCHISDPANIHFHPDDLNNFQSPGTYFQNFAAAITLERGVYIGPNVGIITANHDPRNLDAHLPGAEVRIGEGSWIGMGAVILPGVHLGPATVVAAGAVVTASFPDGHVTVGGVPARPLRDMRGNGGLH